MHRHDTITSSALTLVQRVLETAVRRRGLGRGLKITHVRPNTYASSFSSSILNCRLDDGSRFQLFFKRGGGAAYETFGHKGGVTYEAQVYRQVLQFSKLSLPRYFTSHVHEKSETWLFIEHLDHCLRWTHSSEPVDATVRLAAWIGQFHAEAEARVKRATLPAVRRHDAAYFHTWVTRTWRLAYPLRRQYPWLAKLCAQYETALPWLFDSPQTIIHGELFPKNVLMRGKMVYPVDWESAGIAPGELDLASMTDNWPAKVASACEEQYMTSRWPSGAPSGFSRTMYAAKLFHQFRWLGEPPDRKGGAAPWRLRYLRRAGELLGLI